MQNAYKSLTLRKQFAFSKYFLSFYISALKNIFYFLSINILIEYPQSEFDIGINRDQLNKNNFTGNNLVGY